MNVALIGATGRVGSRIAAELLKRGHPVTGIVRNLDGVTPTARRQARPGRRQRTVHPRAAARGPRRGDQREPFPGCGRKTPALDALAGGRQAPACGWRCGKPRSRPGQAAARFTWLSGCLSSGSDCRHGPSSTSCGGNRQSTGPSCRRPHCWNRASAPANSGSAATSCSPTRMARAGSRWKTTRSPSSTNSSSTNTVTRVSRSAIEAGPHPDHRLRIASWTPCAFRLAKQGSPDPDPCFQAPANHPPGLAHRKLEASIRFPLPIYRG